MRAIKTSRLIILSVLLSLTAFALSGRFERGVQAKDKTPLGVAFQSVGGWRCVKDFPMEEKIVKALDLDDFLFKSYQRDRGEVNLYVGYYRSAKKVGAAHDPLVCFQGQGWSVGERAAGTYRLPSRPDVAISYSSMVAERQGEKEIIVYWFQVNDKATAKTQSQKLAMVLDKISGQGEENAFVRLSAPAGSESPDEVRKRIFRFIDDFYPEFLRYLRQAERKADS